MEAEKIEKILHKALLNIPAVGELLSIASKKEGADWKTLIDWYCEEAAAAIAAAHAAEMEEMREALESLKAACEECGAPDEIEITGGFGLDIGSVWETCNDILAATPKRVRWMRKVKLEEQEAGFFELLAEDGQYIGALYDDEDKSEGYEDGEVYTMVVLGGEDAKT